MKYFMYRRYDGTILFSEQEKTNMQLFAIIHSDNLDIEECNRQQKVVHQFVTAIKEIFDIYTTDHGC